MTLVAGIRYKHTRLGEGKLKKLARPEDGKVLFEFKRYEKECRSGAGRRKLVWNTYNRWVDASLLEELAVREEPVEEQAGESDAEVVRSSSPPTQLGKRKRSDEEDPHNLDDTLGPAPKLSAHERDRKIKKKAPSTERNCMGNDRKTPDSKIPPEKRCKEFNEPIDQGLFVSKGKIKCAPCGEVKQNKWSTLKAHICSSKHIEHLSKWKKRNVEDALKKQDIVEYYKKEQDESMSSVEPDEALFRYRVTETFLGNGVPLAKADGMRNLLRRAGFASTHSSHLKAFIPHVEADEMKRLLSELKGQFVSTAFDGTTRLGEAINMVNRWCSDRFELVQRLTMFRTVEKHMDNKQLARVIGEKLLHELHITVAQHVSFHRDSVKVNGCAVERLSQLFHCSEDILCVCHTLCHVGEHMHLSTLASFIHHWISLVYSHNAAKTVWKEMVGQVVGYSNVRWYAVAEIEMQIAVNFGLLPKAIEVFEERGFGDAHTKAMRKILDEKSDQLELEFAAMLDQRRLVQTTYELEGDRLEILLAFDKIEALREYGKALGSDGSLRNADSVLRKHIKIKVGTKLRKLWPGIGMCSATVVEVIKDLESTLYPGKVVLGYKVRYTEDGEEEDLEEAEIRKWLEVDELVHRRQLIDGLKQGYDYLEDRILGNCDPRYDCSKEFELFRLVRAFNPQFAVQHGIGPSWVDDMAAILPFSSGDGNDSTIDGLKEDLSNYLSAAKDATIDGSDVTTFSNEVLAWWRTNGNSCPKWRDAARKCFAMSPNSAACERVFSLLDSMFASNQKNALADQLQSSLMLKYNKREVG